MKSAELLKEIERLPLAERLAVAEAALRMARKEVEKRRAADGGKTVRQRMAAAAQALRADYDSHGEFTAFTALDSEDFLA